MELTAWLVCLSSTLSVVAVVKEEYADDAEGKKNMLQVKESFCGGVEVVFLVCTLLSPPTSYLNLLLALLNTSLIATFHLLRFAAVV